MKFSEKLREANKVLDWLEEFLKQDVFTGYTDLKLYDIYIYKKPEEFVCVDILKRMNSEIWDNYFQEFCEREFNWLEDYCEDEYGKGFHECIKYIGRTSSFYVTSNMSFEVSDCFDETLCNIIAEEFSSNFYEFSEFLNKEGRLDKGCIRQYFNNSDEWYNHETAEELVDVVDYIINELKKDVLTETADAIDLWEHIATFKENQCTNFNEFLEYEYENYPERFLSICPHCGERSNMPDIDEDSDTCEHCGGYYDGRDLDFELTVDSKSAVIESIEYDKLLNSHFEETIYEMRDVETGAPFYAVSQDIYINRKEDNYEKNS